MYCTNDATPLGSQNLWSKWFFADQGDPSSTYVAIMDSENGKLSSRYYVGQKDIDGTKTLPRHYVPYLLLLTRALSSLSMMDIDILTGAVFRPQLNPTQFTKDSF
jgi:hypothetical protein